ncbi:MAG TPA: TetR/AcrR family transcriptional regulator [Acidimicrobiales bacterium]|nr:TetR/AcrR family transcriptional regulator [Acidimicrobiales bacterium]
MTSTAPALDTRPSVLPPRATSDGTLRRVQETALALFAERGYHGVSMRDLAAAVGMRASSLYVHVASKEDLLLQLILLGHEEHRDGMRTAVLDADGGGSATGQLAAATRAHVRMHAAYPTLALVANNELRSLGPEAQRTVHAVRGDAEGMLRDIIERGVRLGEFDCPDPWLAMAAIGAIGIRVASWYVAGESPYSVEQVCDRYAEFALRIAGAELRGGRRATQ